MSSKRIRKEMGGAEKIRKKKREEALTKSMANSMLRYVKKSETSKIDEVLEHENIDEVDVSQKEEDINIDEHGDEFESEHEYDKNESGNEYEKENENEKNSDREHENGNKDAEEETSGVKDQTGGDINDPGNWKKVDSRMRDFLVEKGPVTRLPVDYNFPRDCIGRCFSHSSYTREIRNGEKQDRRWLVYSKVMDMDIDIAIAQVKGLVSFFKSYRETGFQAAKVEAQRIAIEMEIDPVFSVKAKRPTKRKRYHDEEPEIVGEDVILTGEENFRVNYFIKIVDQGLVFLETRFDQLQSYEKTFGFLFDLKKLKLANDDKLIASCANLEAFLKHGSYSDIDGNDLFLEIKYLRGVLPEGIEKVVEILDFLKKMESIFPNTWTSYRIMMTIPVSVASAERSFSKLKLIKSYLRSTMSQERLNGLSMLSIEKRMAEKLDYTSLMNDFASRNARRLIFQQ